MTEPKPKEKSFCIDKKVVWEAWKQVKANQGAPGVDLGYDLAGHHLGRDSSRAEGS